ncbi:MAG: VWA domain-containing protein [Deltaproteobacteria bacterium]|jgi:magnesium chelatase subunit D|nr:VWA domain-containing protein [Deltaproteobacteria bacterium]
MERFIYPLSALVGQEDMVEALLILAVDPSIGGLLLVGEKGTAKSTAARALAELMPPILAYNCPFHCKPEDKLNLCPECTKKPPSISLIPPPFRTVPLGVTEERLLGGLDFEKTMLTGHPVLRAGILGEANNGLIYIDEVNLLDPGLAHLILDAASSGKVQMERDGFSYSHPAKVALLGSMNPEEGALGPQLSDRFAMSVQLKGEQSPEKRLEIIRRRLAFEKNPLLFRTQYAEASSFLTFKIQRARFNLHIAQISAEAFEVAAKLAAQARASGHRADLALAKAAKAKAVLDSPSEVRIIGPEWVEKVAHFILPSRVRIAEETRTLHTLSTEFITERPTESFEKPYILNAQEVPPDGEFFSPSDKTALKVYQVGENFEIITPKLPQEKGPKEQKGRRSYEESLKARGRAYRTTARRLGRPLSLSATLRAAAPHQRERAVELGESSYAFGKIILKPSDFREKVYRLKTGRLVIFVVDSSGSIGTLYRMEEAKAAAMSLLTDAYQKRDRVAIITFYGTIAELLLPPTNSPDLAGRLLTSLPSGGKTPMAQALILTHKLLKTERAKDPLLSPFVILMTDGRPNIPIDPEANPWHEVLNFADILANDPKLHFLLIDTDRGAYNEFKLTKELAKRLHAPHLNLEDLREGRLEKWLDTLQ